MSLGKLIAIVLLLTEGKFITKRLPFPALDAAFRQIHKLGSVLLFFLIFLHPILSLRKCSDKPFLQILFGILTAIGIGFIVVSHCIHHSIDPTWLAQHKIVAALVLISFILHIIFGRIS